MSVVLRSVKDGKYHVFAKGADSTMIHMARSVMTEGQIMEVQNKVDELACLGLRTLVFGHKEISKADADKLEIGDVEAGLKIIGMTGVEDML